MKTFVPFIIFSLMVSCVPLARPIPTSVATPLFVKRTPTNTLTPIPVTPSPINPYSFPTAINTPHTVPTKMGYVTSQEAFELYEQRVGSFEGTLQFSIKISDVKITQLEDVTSYLVMAEGRLTNISNKPIVVRKNLSTGFTLNEDVSWGFSYRGSEFSYGVCCMDTFGIRFLSPEDYVLLQPTEFQNYLLPFELPAEISGAEGVEMSLSDKKITLVASYIDVKVGYDEGPPLDSSKFVDMNSWVGKVQSNSVECVFP